MKRCPTRVSLLCPTCFHLIGTMLRTELWQLQIPAGPADSWGGADFQLFLKPLPCVKAFFTGPASRELRGCALSSWSSSSLSYHSPALLRPPKERLMLKAQP